MNLYSMVRYTSILIHIEEYNSSTTESFYVVLKVNKEKQVSTLFVNQICLFDFLLILLNIKYLFSVYFPYIDIQLFK